MDNKDTRFETQLLNALFETFTDEYRLDFYNSEDPHESFTNKYAPKNYNEHYSFDSDLVDLEAAHQFAGFKAGFKTAIMLITGL